MLAGGRIRATLAKSGSNLLEGGRECYRAEGPSACAQGASLNPQRRRLCMVLLVKPYAFLLRKKMSGNVDRLLQSIYMQ